jgi:hypothetical protein
MLAVPDANSDGPALAGYPAPHADFPRIETGAGPVLKTPNVVPVFFGADSFEPQIERFLAQLSSSSYWTETTGEYGVSGLQLAPSIVVSDPIPTSTTDLEIQSWLAAYLDGTHSDWPAIADSNVYVVFYPDVTTITKPGEASCTDFGGYHSEGTVQRARAASEDASVAAADAGLQESSFAYVVLPRCATFNKLSGLDALTAAVSHELVETATNPFNRTRRAFGYIDPGHVAWAIGLNRNLFFSELADLCESQSSDRAYQRLLGDFVVSRSWSNLAAGSNRDPCVPAGPGVYFGAAPELDELEVISNDGGFPNAVLTSGVRIRIGQSKTVAVRLFSTGPTPDWYVTPFQRRAAGEEPTLRLELDKNLGNNGDVLELSITRLADGPTFGGTEIVLVSSAMPPTGQGFPPASTNWYGFVQN